MDTYFAVAAVFAKETNYLKEWIHFHLLVGVEKFYLICNDVDPYLSTYILKPFIDQGIVILEHMPPVEGEQFVYLQMRAYQWAIKATKDKVRWLAVIDLDEFLMPNEGYDIKTVLSEFERPRIAGVIINWLNFGSSGLFFPPRLQVEGFTKRANDSHALNAVYKTIIYPKYTIKSYNPHSFKYETDWVAVDEFDQQIFPASCLNINRLHIGKKLRINHYRTRSWLEYLEKHRKWNANGHPDMKKDDTAWYFTSNDTNNLIDLTAHRYLPELKKRIDVL